MSLAKQIRKRFSKVFVVLAFCRHMVKPDNHKNHEINFLSFTIVQQRELVNFFQPCLELVNCTNNYYFFAFANHLFHLNE